MFTRKLFIIVIILGMLLGIFSIAQAAAPVEVGADWCVIWLPDENFNWYPFPGEGQLVFNPNHYVWNLVCHGVFDYQQYATWEEFCNWIPGACQGNKIVANKLEYFKDYFDEDGNYLYTDFGSANLIVKSNGEARWNAQISYNCYSFYDMNQAILELPSGFWSVGTHEYTIEFFYEDGSSVTWWNTFTVDPTTPIYKGQVRMGFNLLYNWGIIDTINPAQDTFMAVTSWGPEYLLVPLDYAVFSFDGGLPIAIDASNVQNLCSYANMGLFMRHWGPTY